jgi:isocitrate dehydrogenase kinase/phosphatase
VRFGAQWLTVSCMDAESFPSGPDAGRRPEPSPTVKSLRAAAVPADQPQAQAVARAVLDGFDKHYEIFRAATARAKDYFENAAWSDAQRVVRDRIEFYDKRVAECVERLRAEFGAELSIDAWAEAKLAYIGMLVEHLQPELAETFFNSVVTQLCDTGHSDNRVMFVRAALSTEYIDSDPPIFRSYYPAGPDLTATFRQVFADFGWRRPFADLERDLRHLLRVIDETRDAEWQHLEPNYQVQVLSSAFYRNKAAYVVGKLINGFREQPFVVAVLNDGRALSLDAILLDETQLDILFSLSRAYCMVDMEVPAGYVKFLRRMMPTKNRFELYTMLGLGKQGKTLFYRDLLEHLRRSQDRFVQAPGFEGKVMLVFTLPSYPYVFKVIKDVFGPGKETDRATVEAKFAMAKHVDRVGRMADTLEFTNLALPRERFSDTLLEQLASEAASTIENRPSLLIRHCYVERRLVPLNIYLDRATPAELDDAVLDYGNAIRELAIANIFPGDMLWRNFGVTRHNRVLFYDYDEIEYLTGLNFRRMPEAPNPEAELGAEPWYAVAHEDVFPEEFASFLLADPRIDASFRKHHADLLEPGFWQECQRRIEADEIVDFFPYPQSLRFEQDPCK